MTKKKCPSCEMPIGQGDNFCSQCGFKFLPATRYHPDDKVVKEIPGVVEVKIGDLTCVYVPCKEPDD